MDGLTEGRIVHYVMPDGEHRPAIVVKVWDHDGPTGTANLQVFTDGTNDNPWGLEQHEQWNNVGMDASECGHGHIWRTSIRYSEEKEVHTWHWIEKA
jgi:hypothetical protein